MDNYSKIFLDNCIDFINKKEIKEYFKKIMTPMFNTVLKELFPYILICMVFVFISFLLLLGNFILLYKHIKMYRQIKFYNKLN